MFSAKNWNNWCPLAGILFVFKKWLSTNFNNSSHNQKKPRNKTILFPVDKNHQLKYDLSLKIASTYFTEGFHLEEKPLNRRAPLELAKEICFN